MQHRFLEFIYILYCFIRWSMVFIFNLLHFMILNYVPVNVRRRKLFYLIVTILLYLFWGYVIILFVLLSIINMITLIFFAEYKLCLHVLSEVMLLFCIFYYLGAVITFTYVNVIILPSLLLHLIDYDKPFTESVFYFLYKIVKNYDAKCNNLMDYFIHKGNKELQVGNSKTLHYVVWYVLYILCICIFYYCITSQLLYVILFLFDNASLLIEVILFVYNSPITFYTVSHVFVLFVKQLIGLYSTLAIDTVFAFLNYVISFFL